MRIERINLMGILNVTPDSFFDGGKYDQTDLALKHAAKMVNEGADILDVGGESSQPGAAPVRLQEELERVVPVVKRLAKKFPNVRISVDTTKSEVARQCLNEGARIINDISALRMDEKMIDVLRKFRPQVVLMHMRGNPRTMQKKPKYTNVVHEVKSFLAERIRWAVENGFPRKKIWIDPGIGFGKTVQHNLQLLKHLSDFSSLNCPILIGCSRKSFIGNILKNVKKILPPEERLEGSLAAACWAYLNGASILRVHDVGATKKAIRILESIRTVQ